MNGPVLRLLAASALLALGGCAATRSTEEIVLDYNRSFANSRNEMIILNILRSAAREPLQFSTMGTITGQVGNSGQLTIPFTNVVAGGRDIISPSLQITDAVNPSITIVPLGAREFASAILTPLTTEDIQLFLHSGWDAEFLLPLVIGGVVCPNGELLLNSGIYEVENADGSRSTAVNDAFVDFFRDSAPEFRIASEPGPGVPQSFTVSDEQAIALLRDGAGAGRVVHEVRDAGRGMKRIELRPAQRPVVRGLRIAELCARVGTAAMTAAPRSLQPTSAGGSGGVVLRSVQTMIYYLGESHRVRYNSSTRNSRGLVYYGPFGSGLQTLFKLEWGPSTSAAVGTTFHDVPFFIPRLNLRTSEGSDRTLKTLSFLDQLIALQTNESVIRGTQPVIVNPQ